ncbi:hypothetical protein KBB68_03665 [Candidatus Babeliales bacterium]|nr:hypothetical protein [Candidatus Babeliales bacterium]
MTLRSKSFILSILFFSFLLVQTQDLSVVIPQAEIQSFQLTRVACSDADAITTEESKAESRVFKKYLVTSLVVIGAMVALYLCYEIRDAAAVNDAARSHMKFIPKDVDIKKIPESLQQKEVLDQSGASWFVQSMKNKVLGVGKFFAESGLLLTSSIIMNGAYAYAANKWNQAYTEETVLWYAHEQTQIPNLFNDLKLYATDYDLHASLLSTELFSLDAQIQMKAFVKNLVESSQNYLGNDMFKDPAYFQYLLNDMKKKYVQKGKELEKLQEFVVPAAGKRHRAVIQEHATMLFTKDMNRREDIANMCELFAQEIQKLIAFITMRGGLRQKVRIVDMVESCNAFLAYMEKLLNSTPEELQSLSKNDAGMFTSVYEYEKLFSEQINFLHRYCKLNS